MKLMIYMHDMFADDQRLYYWMNIIFALFFFFL